MSRAALAVALCGLALLAGCGGARPSADGLANGYTPGVPDFDLDASVLSAVDPVEIEALVSIPRSSLVFTRDDEGFRTIVRTAFRLSDRENTPLASPARADTLRVATYAETASFVPLVVRQEAARGRGRARGAGQVEDARTGRHGAPAPQHPCSRAERGPHARPPSPSRHPPHHAGLPAAPRPRRPFGSGLPPGSPRRVRRCRGRHCPRRPVAPPR